MSALPNSARTIDLLRWVVAHANQPFDPNMVVTATHTSDWQWQAVLAQMEDLKTQGYFTKHKQDPAGSTYWSITPKGENYLRALERAENTVTEASPADRSSPVSEASPITSIAPPVIVKEFGAPSIPINGTTKLTFTITNPNPKSDLTDIGFTDSLPAGLLISSPNGLVGSWAEGDLVALAGSDRIGLSGAKLAARASCTFQLNVTGTAAATTNNTTSVVTSKEGGTGNTASASITVGAITSDASPVPSTTDAPNPKGLWVIVADPNDDRSLISLQPGNKFEWAVPRSCVKNDWLLLWLIGGIGFQYLCRALDDARAPRSDEHGPAQTNLITVERLQKPITFQMLTKDKVLSQWNLVLSNMQGAVQKQRKSLLTDLAIWQALRQLIVENNPDCAKLLNNLEGAAEVTTGPSTHVARDRWTVDDSLGYSPYAYAIYRFLTDSNTVPPLAISVQAPWGGGKTSLMRMIQGQLDPEALKRFDSVPPVAESATVKQVQTFLNKLSASIPTGNNSKRQWTGWFALTAAKASELLKKAKRGIFQGSATTPGTTEPGHFLVPPIPGAGKRCVTIWFNAWKYESTAQVWAGLADSIVRQIGDRLGIIQRELFWLRLHLLRIDVAKIRNKIHEQIASRLWEKLSRTLAAYLVTLAASTAVIARINHYAISDFLGWRGALLSSGVALFTGLLQWMKTAAEIQNQPARLSIGEFVEAPDYAANLGFVHHVVDDLKKVFEAIPQEYRPMVVFIDDLDRCSPNKVSDVIEAVNLFLAGEFPDCMFVLGIDDEMVAAALDRAHSEVISKLPSYAKTTSIGWRFMDKFVQLPFIVPPPTRDDLAKYADSLFSKDKAEAANINLEARDSAAQKVEKADVSAKGPGQIAEEVAKEQSLTSQQQQTLEREVAVMQQMDRNIKAFSDEEEKIKALLSTSVADFSSNPRDIKRFVNVFRFYYFLRAAREARKDPTPSLDQLRRWIFFSLKWPEGVRYLWRTRVAPEDASHPQLEALEKLGKGSQNLEEWRKGAAEALGIEVKENTWISSQEVMRFFQAESKRSKDERLSASCGKGLW